MNKIFVFFRNRFHVFLIMILIVGIVFLLNRFSFRWDLTSSQIFTLSDVSKSLVANLKDPLRVKVFISKNIPPPLNDLQIALEDLLIEYQEAANGNFVYSFYNVTESETGKSPEVEANIKLANDYGVFANQMQTLNKDQIQLVKIYSGIVIEYGNLIERIPFITDTTRLEYQITTILDRMNKKLNSLLSLETSIEATLYLSDNFIKLSPFFQIQGLAGVKESMNEVFEKVNQENYGKVNYSAVSQITPKDEEFLTRQGVRLYPWKEFKSPDGKTVPAGKGVAVLMLSYKDRVELVELLSPQASLQIGSQGLQQVIRYVLLDLNNYENTIDGIIDNLLDINDYIAYLSDKGTISVASENNSSRNPFIQQNSGGEAFNFYRLLERNYKIEQIKLDNLSTKYKTLVIAGAKEEFSDYDLFLIDQYLMQGRSLLILQDVLGNKQPLGGGGRSLPQWEPINNRLDKLLESYGVRIQKTYVMDKESYISRGQGQNGGITEQQIYFAPIIQNQNINHDFIPLKNFKTFITLEMSPIELIAERIEQQKVNAIQLFSSSVNSWVQGENVSLVPSMIQPPSTLSEYKKSDLAYALEGEFNSFFSDKPIPAKSDESTDADSEVLEEKNSEKKGSFRIQDSELILKQSKSAKVVVVGSSALIKNNIIDERGEGVNAQLAVNFVDYLSGRTDWAVMRSKHQRVLPLEPYNAQASFISRWLTNRNFLKWVNMLGVPILVGLIGFAVYTYRSSRRKAIALQFLESKK